MDYLCTQELNQLKNIMFQKLLMTLFCIGLTLHTTVAIQPACSFPIPQKINFAGQTIPLNRYDMRERFDREQISIAYNHSTSLLIIKKANKYFPIIEPILAQKGIPEDFKYLAVIESNLEPRALSPAQAAGIWQLMPKTGEQLGLTVNSEVDERYHIEKATEAACKYFKSAYSKFNDWATVAASYNGGMGRISEELAEQQTDTSLDLLLTSETSRYVFRILAMKQFLENPKQFGFHLLREDFYPTIRTNQITVNTMVEDWTEWAKQFGISYSQLKDFNIWLRDRKLTNENKTEYQLKIPEKTDFIYDIRNINIHNPNWVDAPVLFYHYSNLTNN